MDKDFTDSKLFVVSWNTTKMCNLRCEHCYLDAEYLDGTIKDEFTTEEGFRLIDEIHEVNPDTVLILTGGEPLLRKDIFSLGEYAANIGLMPVLGTNGTLFDENAAKKVIDHGIAGIGVSIDSLKSEVHDKFRGLPGALEMTIKGLECAAKHNIGFQIQTTVTKDNFDEMENIIDYCYQIGCKVFNLFFLVCTGRGQGMSDITPAQYEEMLGKLVHLETQYKGKMMIKAKCAPHFKRVAHQQNPDSSILKGYTSDCLAGKHYCRITSEGDMTSCPYMPLSVGNVKEKGFAQLWRQANVFHELRKGDLKGKCNDCEFKIICGGCRARSYSSNNDYLLDDPWCEYDPPKDGRPVIKPIEEEKYWIDEKYELTWSPDALKRLNMIPKFVKNMVVKSVEKYAISKGYRVITPDVMKESREKSGNSHNMAGMGAMGGMGNMMKSMSGMMKSFAGIKDEPKE